MTDSASDDALASELAEHLQQCRTAVLATVDSRGLPHASYAPLIRHHNAFYLFLSQLAAHTAALQQQPALSLMLIEDEASARSLFARKRVTLTAQVHPVPPSSAEYRASLDAFQKDFGETVGLLRQLPDFVLFRIAVQDGRFVKGFGQAHQLNERLEIVAHLGAKAAPDKAP